MKSLITIFLLIGTTAFAKSHTTYADGTGQASAYCMANDYFCPRNIEQRSERDGTSNAQFNCQLDHGTPLSYTATCNTYCSPAYIPPNSSTWVNCRSTCRMQCQIED